jgi:hypothetical protein
MTLTNLLNETFVTLFADNQPFISAVTPGKYDAPLTYSLAFDDDAVSSDKCIYIIEDSQLDMGLLIAVERNVNRIFQIIADYLAWNDEQIAESMRVDEEPVEEETASPAETEEETAEEEAPVEEKKGFFGRLMKRIKGWFKKKSDPEEQTDGEPTAEETEQTDESEDNLTPRQKRRAARKAAREAKAAANKDDQAEGEEISEEPEIGEEKTADAPDQDEEKTAEASDGDLTPRQKKQAEKKAAREAKAAKRQEEKMRKRQEREAKKEAQAIAEAPQETVPATEVTNEQSEVKEDE